MHTSILRGKHDAGSRRLAFIDAATRVFAEKGYDAATTREVAERAGCSEGLIHRYFGGKRGLLVATLEARAEELAHDFADGLGAADDLETEIRQILLWTVEHTDKHRDSMRVSMTQACIDEELGRYINSRFNEPRIDLTVEKLRRHRDAGRIRHDVDLRSVAEMIGGLGFAGGFIEQVVFGVSGDHVRTTLIETAAVIARGIAPDEHSNSGARS